MSPIAAGDLFVAQRGGTHYKVLAEDLKVATAPGGVPWTPAALGKRLMFWGDTTDASTITLEGDRITQWTDARGVNHGAMVQPTKESQMQWDANADAKVLGSRNITSSAGMYSNTPISIGKPYGFAMVKVLKNPPTAQLFRVAGGAGRDGGTDPTYTLLEYSQWSPQNNPKERFNGVPHTGERPLVQGESFIHISDILTPLQMAANAETDFRDHGLSVYPICLNNIFTRGVPGMSIGATDSDYCEWLVLVDSISEEELQKLEGYFAHKWDAKLGLVAKLPDAHPYKSAPPTK